jgi:lactoylglutathione lyase
MRVNYAIVFVSDMTRAVAFYRDAIGLPLRFQSPGWTEFATGGATLALHLTEGADTPPGGCRPGLSVPEVDPDGLAFSVGEVK